jgi:hypothetical protein
MQSTPSALSFADYLKFPFIQDCEKVPAMEIIIIQRLKIVKQATLDEMGYSG